MLKKLLSLVEGKTVHICAHWDADGVCAAAMLYHAAKGHADYIFTSTKGKPFLIEPEDIIDDADIVICVGIKPSADLLALNKYILYIDNHPNDEANIFNWAIHDDTAHSTSVLLYERMLKGTNNAYLVFLALVGYFSERGDRYAMPQIVMKEAKTLIPDYLKIHEGKEGMYLDIERYVSPLNAGKRMLWSGDIPLEMLKNIDEPESFTDRKHPLAKQLDNYRRLLLEAYRIKVEIKEGNVIDYAIIDDSKNIQGVLAAQYMKTKPLMVLNVSDDLVYGSLRVPEKEDFDAGKFLNSFNHKFKTYNGGGHDKAAAMTIRKDELKEFIDEL